MLVSHRLPQRSWVYTQGPQGQSTGVSQMMYLKFSFGSASAGFTQRHYEGAVI